MPGLGFFYVFAYSVSNFTRKNWGMHHENSIIWK